MATRLHQLATSIRNAKKKLKEVSLNTDRENAIAAEKRRVIETIFRARAELEDKLNSLNRSQTPGFVVGNGTSRKGVRLDLLQEVGPVYGCNGLYRDFSPNLLIARDRGIRREVEKNYSGKYCTFDDLTEKSVMLEDRRILISDNWDAGLIALELMCIRESVQIVYLLGFDPYGIDGHKNNVYVGTENYAPSTESYTYNAWQTVRQFQIFCDIASVKYPDTEFCRVGEKPEAFKEARGCSNLSFVSYDEFYNNLEVYRGVSDCT